MRANEKNLLRFLEGTDKSFIIPVYQRNYDWKKSNCKQLFDDLIRITKENYRTHFMGSIVHIYNQSGKNYEYMIIDGQQRLTTISILLLAIYNAVDKNDINGKGVNINKIKDEYLIDKYAPENKKIKLKPIKDDSVAFEKLFESDMFIKESNVTYNYDYFYNRLLKMPITVEMLYKAIEQLMIVEIELKANEDDPQLIFESLNSTGLDLTEADKVRNYILMKLERNIQEELYNKFWNKIEINTMFNVSAFLRDYLTIKRNKIPNIKAVYFVFKDYHKNGLFEIRELLEELLDYSKIYKGIINSDFSNNKINKYLSEIKELETYVSYPFILELLMDLKNKIINDNQAIECLKAVRDYVFRRIICEIPTNSLNKTFMTLNNEIKKQKDYSKNYSEICKYILINKESYTRFPTDEEFLDKFLKRDIYNQQSKNKVYLLTKLENYDNKERVDIETLLMNRELSIEHIMPQTLTEEWKVNLGHDWLEIHQMYLHTIGNLTLTGYNSEMKNSSFIKKRDIKKGFKQSNLKLNRSLAMRDKWDKEEIINRGQELSRIALAIWSYPVSNFDIEEKHSKLYTLDDEKNFTGEKIISYSLMDGSKSVRDTTEFYSSILKEIYELDNSIFIDIISGKKGDSRLEKCFSKNDKGLRSPRKLSENIFFEVNLSTEDKLGMLRKIINYMGLNYDEVNFEIK